MSDYDDSLVSSDEDELSDKKAARLRDKILCLVCVVTIFGGAVVLKFAEGWTFVTSVYVIVQIITTIGYGDICVTTDSMRLFMSFYVLWCLIIVAYVLNDVLTSFLEGRSNTMRRVLRTIEGVNENEVAGKQKKRAMNTVIVAFILFLTGILFGALFYGFVIKGCPIGHDSNECVDDKSGMPTNFVEAFYMSVITCTTVGFGDYRPRTLGGRIIGVFWMIYGVAATAYFVSSVQNYFFLVNEEKRIMKVTVHNDLDRKVFEEIDSDGDGYLTKSEFRVYVLIKHGLIKREDLDAIDEKYDLLDSIDPTTTDRITFDMVERFRAKNQTMRELRVHSS